MTENQQYIAPEWAKKVIWYQIFPERFRNGNPSANPTVKDIKGSYPHDTHSPWQVHPWGSEWYKLEEYEQKNNYGLFHNLQRRRYGGDLQGILDKLDYLQELGISAIYLNPVFFAPSSHKYDGKMYHHIDPTFGPDPEGDKKLIEAENHNNYKHWCWTSADKLMLKLIDEVHRRHMHIIFDGVFNHLGIMSFPFQDIKKHGKKSPYKRWFHIYNWNKKQFNYKKWCGCNELPAIRQDKNGIVAEPREYIFASTKRWMDPYNDGSIEHGIDGWRLDVAACVKHPFWKAWRKHVLSIRPNAYLTAELIEEDIEVLKPYLQGDEFDAIMNYNFAFSCANFFIYNRTNVSQFDKSLRDFRESFHHDMSYIMQNLLDSHDTMRLSSHIVNRNYSNNFAWRNYFFAGIREKNLQTRKPNEQERLLQKLMVSFQMTYVGAPMIYYGDEVGMWGVNDPCCRKPMLWDDVSYESENTLPNGTHTSIDNEVSIDYDLLDYYKTMTHIHNNNIALQLGDFKTELMDNEQNIYAFSRTYNDNTILAIFNNSDKKQTVIIPWNRSLSLKNLITEEIMNIEEHKAIITLLPWSVAIEKAL